MTTELFLIAVLSGKWQWEEILSTCYCFHITNYLQTKWLIDSYHFGFSRLTLVHGVEGGCFSIHLGDRLLRVAQDGLTQCLVPLWGRLQGQFLQECLLDVYMWLMYFLAQWLQGIWALYLEAGFSERCGGDDSLVCVFVHAWAQMCTMARRHM